MVLSDKPYELTSIFDWCTVNIWFDNFDSTDYMDWCEQHEMCHATDYRKDEAKDMMETAIRESLKKIYAKSKSDVMWSQRIMQSLIPEIAECWDVPTSFMKMTLEHKWTAKCEPFINLLVIQGGFGIGHQKKIALTLQPKDGSPN